MATLKKATTLLEKAKKSKPADIPKILTESHELILKINEDASVSPDDKSDLLVTEAEIAFDLQNYDLANNDLDAVFQNKKLRKDHAARASYMKVQMLLNAYNQSQTHTLEDVLNIVNYILQVAVNGKLPGVKYSNMVFNTSVMYWNLCSSWLSNPAHKLSLLSSFETVIKSLEDINDNDYEWRLKLQVQLTKLFEECKQKDKAVRSSWQCFLLATEKVPAFKEEVLRLCLLTCQTHADTVSKLRQEVANDNQLKAAFLVQSILIGITKERAKIIHDLRESFHICSSNINANGELLSEVSQLAFFNQDYDLAAESAQLLLNARKFQNVRARLRAEMVECQLMVLLEENPGLIASSTNSIAQLASNPSFMATNDGSRAITPLSTTHPKNPNPSESSHAAAPFKQRVEALKRLTRMLELAVRTNTSNPSAPFKNIIENISILIWNMALPLLQPSSRQYILKPFNRVTQALDSVQSTLNELMSRVHYELAVAEMEVEDVLAKAKTHVEKAIQLNANEEFFKGYLEPLRTLITIKLNLYDEPEKIEEQALLYIEKAKDSSQLEALKSMLNKAVTLLNNITIDFKDFDRTKQCIFLWFSLCKVAFEGKQYEVCNQAFLKFVGLLESASQAQPTTLSQRYKEDKQLQRTQANAYFVAAQHAAAQMKRQINKGSKEILQELENTVMKQYMNALNLGIQMKEDWIIVNSLNNLYQYFLPQFKQNQFQAASGVLQDCYNTTALQTLSQNKDFVPMVITLCYCVASGLEQKQKEKQAKPEREGSAGKRKTKQTVKAVVPTVPVEPPQGSVELKTAEEICRFAVSLNCTSYEKRFVLRVLTRVQIARGGISFPAKLDAEGQLIMILEQLRFIPDSEQSRKKELVQKCYDILVDLSGGQKGGLGSAYFNLELFALSAYESLNTKQYALAKTIAGVVLESYAARREIKPLEWSWLSCVECTMGQVAEASITPAGTAGFTMSQSVQNQLREQALQHFVLAAEHACVGVPESKAGLCFEAAQHFWNCSIPFMKSKVTRQIILFPLQDTLSNLTNSGDATWDFRTQLYRLVLQCYRDQRMWEMGLNAAQEAFQVLPRHYSRQLWKYRILFMRRMKQAISLGIFAKEGDMKSQSEVYAVAARSSVDPEESRTFYKKALDLSKDLPAQRLEYLMDYALWLFTVGGSTSESTIGEAESLLLEAVTIAKNKDNLLMSPTEAIIETPTKEPSTPAGEEYSPQSLEVLCRVYLLLARIVSPKRQEYCFQAHFCVMRLWDLAFKTFVTETKSNIHWPTNILQWTDYSIPESFQKNLQQSCSANDIGEGALFPNALTALDNPHMLIFNLDLLAEYLTFYGCHAYCIPIYQMIAVLSTSVIQSENHTAIALFRLAKVFEVLNLPEQCSKYSAMAGAVPANYLTRELRNHYREEVRQREYLNTLAHKHVERNASLSSRMMSARLSLTNRSQSTNRSGSSSLATGTSSLAGVSLVEDNSLESYTIRELWVMQAKELIDWEYYGAAKDMLLESLLHAKTFEDNATQAKCYHLLSIIADREDDVAGAIRTEMEAQNIPGMSDSAFWKDSLLHLVDLLHRSGKSAQAKEVLLKSYQAFQKLRQQYPAHAVDYEVTEAVFQYALAYHSFQEIQAIQQQLKNQSGGVFIPSSSSSLSSVPQTATTLKAMYATVEKLAIQSIDFCESIRNRVESLLGMCPLVMEAALLQVQLMLCSDTANVPPPSVHNYLAPTNNSAEFTNWLHERESKLDRAIHMLGSSDTAYHRWNSDVLKALAAPLPGGSQKVVYQAGASGISHPFHRISAEAKMLLSKLHLELHLVQHNLKGKPKQVKSGTIEQLIEMLDKTGPTDTPIPHLSEALVQATSANVIVEGTPRTQIRALFNLGKLLFDLSLLSEEFPNWRSLLVNVEASTPDLPLPSVNPPHFYVEQAIRSLMRSIDLAQNFPAVKEATDVVCKASETLVECFSTFYQNRAQLQCVQFLLIFQNFQVQQEQLDLYHKLSPKGDPEKLFLNEAASLQSWKTSNRHHDNVAAYHKLPSALTWKRAIVTASLDDIIKLIPKNLLFITLQSSSDKETLYMGALSTDITEAYFSKISTTAAQLQQLMDLRKSFLSGVHNTFLKGDSTAQQDEANNQKFADLLTAIEAFLQPLFAGMNIADLKTKYHVVLMPDSVLAPFPLEALAMFEGANISRDFSMFCFYQRFKDQSKSKIGLAVKRKFSYVVDPVKEGVYPGMRPVSTSSTVSDAGSNSILESFCYKFFKKPRQAPSQQGNKLSSAPPPQNQVQERVRPGWEGLIGSDRIPTPEDWQQLLLSSNVFIYWGCGSVLSHLDPSFVSVLDMSECNIAILLSQSMTMASMQRQHKAEASQGTHKPRLFDSPHDTALLFSLRGVNALVTTQWGYTDMMKPPLHELHDEMIAGKTVAESVLSIRKNITRKAYDKFNCVVYGIPMLTLQQSK